MDTVSIVVTLEGSVERLRRFIAATDQLRTPVTHFEVVFLVPPAVRVEELGSWQSYRPNLRLIDVQGEHDRHWLDDLGTDFTLRVTLADALTPGSVNSLCARAAETGADAVAGRVVGSRGELPAAYDEQSETLAGGSVAVEDPAIVWLVRTSRLASQAAAWWLPDADLHRALLVNPAAVVRYGEDVPVPERAQHVSTAWTDGRLGLRITLGGTADRARLSLQNRTSNDAYLLPGHLSTSSTVTTVTVDIDPLTLAGGHPLAAGEWTLQLEVLDGESATVVSLPGVPTSVALVDDTFMVIGGSEACVLEFAPRGGRLPTPLEASAASVTESYRGSLLEVAVPDLHTYRSHGVDGVVQVGTIGFPGRLEIDETGGTLRALVSGIAGTEPLATRFGPGGVRATGLSLQIDGLGAMSVISTPAVAKPAARAKAGDTGKTAKSSLKTGKTASTASTAKKTGKARSAAKSPDRSRPQSRGPVAKFRRALPSSLGPVMKRLGRVPALRKLYRRATGS